MLRFRIRYRAPADLRADFEQQWSRGGYLIRVDVPAAVEQFSDAEVEVDVGHRTIVVVAEVVQIFPGVGVAVTCGEEALASLAALAAEARGAEPTRGARSQHTLLGARDSHVRNLPPTSPPPPSPAASSPSASPDPDEIDDPPAPPAPAGLIEKIRNATTAEKVQIALKGGRDERAIILRDPNPLLHAHVLRNPNLQLEEIVAIARMRTVSPELLKQIADKREWSQRQDVAIALVRNPKIAIPVALKLLDVLSPADLRQLAKDGRTRTAIQQGARRKVIG